MFVGIGTSDCAFNDELNPSHPTTPHHTTPHLTPPHHAPPHSTTPHHTAHHHNTFHQTTYKPPPTATPHHSVYNSPKFLDKSKEQSENIESTHNVLADIMNTLACLAVREEMCVCVCDEGGVKGVMGLLARWEGGGGGSKSDIALLKAALQVRII